MTCWRSTPGLVVLLASACDPPDDDMTSFGERTFLSESVEGRTLVADTRVRLDFDRSGGMAVSAGCNSIGSEAYALDGGELVAGELYSTEIGCDEPLHEQDAWLQGFFAASPAYTLDEPRLTLVAEGVTLVMLDREVADPDRALLGEWRVDGLVTGGSVGFGPSPQQAKLEFGEDGELGITTPCARGRASYEAGIATMTLSGVGIGAPDCMDDENAALIDDHMRAVLMDGTFDYGIDASRLQLMRSSIGLWLTKD
ncbi:MAG TPA: META domain-containing protein [Nannocystaceae bacterium]|nr:META domain-containing protein [Nannocystaceae bacterium]